MNKPKHNIGKEAKNFLEIAQTFIKQVEQIIEPKNQNNARNNQS